MVIIYLHEIIEVLSLFIYLLFITLIFIMKNIKIFNSNFQSIIYLDYDSLGIKKIIYIVL